MDRIVVALLEHGGTLIHVMHVKETPPASRVRAADALLDHAGGAYAIDLTHRVQKLEQKDEESDK
jgi:hypothetical protein